MRLGDIDQSRAVLIGSASYDALPDLPAVRRNLADLRKLLLEPAVWGLPPEHCVALQDEHSTRVILDAVHEAADQARDTLLIYYAGHGHLDQRMGLRLATPASDPARPYRSLEYDEIRQAIMGAVRCPSKVVILDCCYSGLATRVGMGDHAEMATRAAVEGSWLITASAEHVPAISPPDEPHTAFTGELVRLLDQGLEEGPEFLDVKTLYTTLHERLTAKGRPAPQQRVGNQGTRIVVARNRWYDRARTAGPGPYGPSLVPPAELRRLPTALDALVVLIDERRGRDDAEDADALLRLLGRHRDTQEVAATLAEFGYRGRSRDLSALLDGLAERGVADSVAVLDVLFALDAGAAVDAVLAREAGAASERIAELADLLAASALPESCLNQLLDEVVAVSVGRPRRMSELVGRLLRQNHPAEADHLLNQCRAQGSPAELAVLADALREAGHESAAFRLYPAAIEELAVRPPDRIAALALGFHRHGDEKSATALASEAADGRRTTAERADLLVAFDRASGLENEVVQITEIFAADLDDETLTDLPTALRDRGGDTVNLHLALLSRHPVGTVLQSVNNLMHNGRPRDVFAILDQAGATRSAEDLDRLTEGLHDTPELRHRRRIFTAVATRTECTVELYRRLRPRPDGRFTTLRAVLIEQPPPVLFDVVVHLVRSEDASLGDELLRHAVETGTYAVSDALIEYADHETAEFLVLAAVGLPDLMRIVHALRQKKLRLEYGSHESARLLLHQPESSVVLVVRALYTADSGLAPERIARRLAALSPAWVAYLLQILAQRGDPGLSGPQLEMITARAILGQAASYQPGDAAKFVAELHRRGLQAVIPQYLAQWETEHGDGIDAFLLAAALASRFGPHMVSKLLQNRAYLPERFWKDAITTAVSEVLHHAHVDAKAIYRFPVPQSMVERLVAGGILLDSEYCLLVIQFKALFSKEIVFTDSGVHNGINNQISYADLARADGVQFYDRRVWLTRSGVAYAATWTMRTETEAEELANLLVAVRHRILEIRNRYAELQMTATPLRIESRARAPLARKA